MLLILGIIIMNRVQSNESIQQRTYKNVTADWSLDREGLEAADVKKLGQYMDAEKGERLLLSDKFLLVPAVL